MGMTNNLSPHFTLDELTYSQYAARTGIDNTPTPQIVTELTRLCTMLLEPARTMLGLPLHVDSGYRSPAVNSNVGGAADSAHMFGRAADVLPIGMSVIDAFDQLRLDSLPYDQIIFECEAWIHLAIAPLGQDPRRQVLIASGSPGHWTYSCA